MITKYYLSEIVNNPDVEDNNYIPEVMVFLERCYRMPKLNEIGMNAELVAGRKHFRALDKKTKIKQKDFDDLVGKWGIVEVNAPKRVHSWLRKQGFDSLTNIKANLKKKTALKKIRAKDPELVTDFIKRFK